MSTRVKIEGTLVRHQYANYRKGRTGTTLSHLVADCIAPLPPSELWCVNDATRKDYTGNRAFFYRTKSGRRPKALEDCEPDTPVAFTATIEPWDNGMGAWISRVVAEHGAEGTG